MKITVALSPKYQVQGRQGRDSLARDRHHRGPAVLKGAIWTAAQLEDTFGIVHSDLIREVNEFVYQRCPKQLN